MFRSAACLFLTVGLVASVCGQGRRGDDRSFSHSRIAVDDSDRVLLRGNVHPQARPENDIGPMDVGVPLQRMILVLTPGPTVERELQQLIAEQHDPSSPNYHQWLTPQEFEQRFGVPPDQIAAAVDWLKSYGFTIDEIPAGGRAINFSGTVQEVERAFHVRMRTFRTQRGMHHANDKNPSIPRALAGIVVGPESLHDFRKVALHTGSASVPPDYFGPQFSNGGNHFLAPSDFATIYDVWRLYGRGINGTGQSIAIVGRTDIRLNDVRTFRNFFGLPANDPVFIHNGPDPGNLGNGEETEADLDVEWSGAVARNATIKFVISKITLTTDGVDLSAQYIVANNVAPIISTSFGQCEAIMGAAENTFWNNTWSQAATQGQTAFVSSGDNGAAGCDDPNPPPLPALANATGGLAVSGLASTPFNVAVGGSQFMDTVNPALYWSATNNAVQGSVLSYIPEQTWNESSPTAGLWAGSGGQSSVYTKPSWQTGPGVPADGKRDIPDVSLSAAGHDGYLIVQGGGLFSVGGTSASSPSFAGLMALVVQKTGVRQGNANTVFYAMANSQYANNGLGAFHDVTTGNNSVPGQAGFNAGPAYDLATGLGTVDAFSLVTQWGQTPTGGGTGNASIVNGTFETGNLTGWTTGGALAPSISSVQKHGGSFSALLGASAAPEPNGDSFLSQNITLPAAFTSATLTFWYWPSSTDNVNFDWQEVQIQNTSGNTLAQVMKVCQNTQAWTQVTVDLTPYKGQTIRLYFNAHGDGFGDLTYMYVDDVTLTVTP